jgi:hypothetical protein
LDKYDNELHIRQDDDALKRKKVTKTSITDENPSIEQRQIMKRRKMRRTVTAVATAAAVVLACNAFTTFAYGVNILQAIVSFTDDVLRKDYVSQNSGNETISSETPVISSEYATLQEALNAFGIESPKSPDSLPDGYELSLIETLPIKGGYMIRALYSFGDKTVTFIIKNFSKQPVNQYQEIEKSSVPIETYSNGNLNFYLFTNIDRNVASWIDGMSDCVLEGDITKEELKNTLNNMYSLEDTK